MTFLTLWGPKKSCSAQGHPLRYIRPVNFLVRTLLIWLLVLAVPAQGAAAVTMAVCGPNHAGVSAAAQSPSVASIERVHHGRIPSSTHVHRDRAAQAIEDATASADATTSTKVGGDVSQHTCSACASCCSAAAILSMVLAVPAAAYTSTLFSAVVPGVDTYAAEGPDRPPRIVLA